MLTAVSSYGRRMYRGSMNDAHKAIPIGYTCILLRILDTARARKGTKTRHMLFILLLVCTVEAHAIYLAITVVCTLLPWSKFFQKFEISSHCWLIWWAPGYTNRGPSFFSKSLARKYHKQLENKAVQGSPSLCAPRRNLNSTSIVLSASDRPRRGALCVGCSPDSGGDKTRKDDGGHRVGTLPSRSCTRVANVMAVKNLVIHTIPAIDSALCALMSSYTFISILDHERWMKARGTATFY